MREHGTQAPNEAAGDHAAAQRLPAVASFFRPVTVGTKTPSH